MFVMILKANPSCWQAIGLVEVSLAQSVVYAPAQIISAPAQLITAPAQQPATGAVVLSWSIVKLMIGAHFCCHCIAITLFNYQSVR